MTNLEVAKTWFRKVWLEEDTSAIYEMFDMGPARGLGDKDLIGPQDFEIFQKMLLALVQNVDIKIDKAFEDGEWISVICTMNCTKRGSEEPLIMTGYTACKVQSDKIVEAHNSWDFISLFEQLGLMPEGTFAHCLSGNKIALAE